MKKWLFILFTGQLLGSACNSGTVQKNNTSTDTVTAGLGKGTDSLPNMEHADTDTTSDDMQDEEVPDDAALKDSIFLNCWHQFAEAVKKGSRRATKQWVEFPLMGAGGCYLPHEVILDPLEDTTGITEYQFDSLYHEIFDSEAASAIMDEKDERNDPVTVWENEGAVSRRIKKMKDPHSNAYLIHVEYVRGRREGGKYFVFARIRNRYRLVALICDGVLIHKPWL